MESTSLLGSRFLFENDHSGVQMDPPSFRVSGGTTLQCGPLSYGSHDGSKHAGGKASLGATSDRAGTSQVGRTLGAGGADRSYNRCDLRHTAAKGPRVFSSDS